MPKRIIVIFVVAIVAIIGGCSDPEVTVYPAIYSDKNTLVPLNRTVYRLSLSRQEIIYWTPGFADQPRRLKNAIIRDKNNWVGEYSDGSAKLLMTDGGFEEISRTESSLEPIFYISWWKWWWLNIFG